MCTSFSQPPTVLNIFKGRGEFKTTFWLWNAACQFSFKREHFEPLGLCKQSACGETSACLMTLHVKDDFEFTVRDFLL